jgi:GT2 family glycosyltransferase
VDSSLPFVSVIVAVRNGEAELPDCVTSLLRMDYPADRREILLVDCGSSDRTAEIAKRYPVEFLAQPRPGICHGRNRGIEVSRGDILAFTDPDCVVSTRWLHELVRPFEEGAVGGVAGAILPYPGSTPAERFAARRRSHTQERPLSHPRRPFAMTPNVAFRREVFERIGGFDTGFPGGGWEDADFCWRLLRQTTFSLEYAPRAVVLHRYRATARAFFVQHIRYGFGLALLRRKYGDELAWSASDSLRAYRDLASAAATVCAAAARQASGNGARDGLQTASFGFLRLLGQRIGSLSGSAPWRHPWRKAT